MQLFNYLVLQTSTDSFSDATIGLGFVYAMRPFTRCSRRPAIEVQGKVVHEAQQCLKTLEKALEGKFFGGDAIGYLDVIVGWYAHWLPIIEEVSGARVVTDEELASSDEGMVQPDPRRRRATERQAPGARQGSPRAAPLGVGCRARVIPATKRKLHIPRIISFFTLCQYIVSAN